MPRLKGSKNGFKTRMTLTCQNPSCQNLFEVEPWQVKMKRKYCSKKCRSPNANLSNSEKAKKRRSELKEKGLCIDCGKNLVLSQKVRCEKCFLSQSQRNKLYRQAHPEVSKKYREIIKNDPIKKKKYNKSLAQNRWRRRLKVIDLFGGVCKCCGETTKEWLEIDHENKDGKKHRSEVGRGVKLLKDLLRNPNKYKIRILCANCHAAITRYGKCPHDNGLL